MSLKRGDYSRIFNAGDSLLNQEVSYVDVDMPIGEQDSIGLYGYRDGSVQIVFSMTDEGLQARLEQRSRDIRLPVSSGSIRPFDLSIYTKDKELLAKFLDIIDEMRPIGKEVKKEIFNTLELNRISDRDGFFAELKKMIDEANLDGALNKAFSVEDEDILHILGEYCESIPNLAWAIECYERIPEGNLHYVDSKVRLAHLLMLIKSSAEQLEIPTDEDSLDEKRPDGGHLSLTYEEEVTINLLNANEASIAATGTSEVQPMVNRLYEGLCGRQLGQPFEFDVRTNSEAVISLAREMKLLQDRVALLEQQLVEAKMGQGSAGLYHAYAPVGSSQKNSAPSSDSEKSNVKKNRRNSF